ncbi:MAG TPA: hypothetical protein VHE61_18195 [Opitutaceae bacterium]|nr:hypothetical protein [Opitutaceae bacterium]
MAEQPRIRFRWSRVPIRAVVFAFGLLAVIIGPLKFGDTRTRPLPPASTQTPAASSGRFREGAVFPRTEEHLLPSGLHTRGSWLGGDGFRGEDVSPWYAVAPRFTIMVAGYPASAGNQLALEFRTATGTVRTIEYGDRDPRETWQPWFISTPAGASEFRIRAVDASSNAGGWLAYSEPYTIRFLPEWQALALLQLFATTCLAVSLLYGPGLVLIARRPHPEPRDLALAVIAGPVVMTVLGLLCWAGGGLVAPGWIARGGILVLLGWIGWHGRKRQNQPSSTWPAGAHAVIAAGALLAGFGVAKANISIGAPGELYGGLVSRSLEVGGHSDSRVPFHVVQVVSHHLAPFSAGAQTYFSPWSFASRGPLAGIIAAPVVLATGADVPTALPDQPWRPFDRQGFAPYRITMIVLASLAGWAVFGLLGALVGPEWGWFAATTALLTPFFVHEMYFTWPKLMAAGLVLVAFLLANERRPVAAGLVLGFAYLFHPLPLLSAPFLAVWVVGREVRGHRRNWRGAAGALLGLTGGIVAIVGVWQAIGSLAPGGVGNQAGFLTYFRLADNQIATPQTWWLSRWQNFANTFLPLHLLAFDPTHESINSVYAPSPSWVRAGFLYWNTLPFALGVPAFLLCLGAVGSACRRAPGTAFLMVVGPALFLIVYWGAADSGLMRHCGQVLFLSIIALSVWSLGHRDDRWRRVACRGFMHPACLAFRGLEIAVMAFGTTCLNGFPHWGAPFAAGDVASLIIALGCLAGAIILLAKAGASLQARLFPPLP